MGINRPKTNAGGSDENTQWVKPSIPVDDKDHLALRKRERDIAAAVAPYVRPRLCAIATSHQQRSGSGRLLLRTYQATFPRANSVRC